MLKRGSWITIPIGWKLRIIHDDSGLRKDVFSK